MTFQVLKLLERFVIDYHIKKIILTTTYSLDNISSMIDSIGIKSQDVLFKPFSDLT